jgi:radical SAM superfamily enzyme YgiQ (UPF0313 family)
MLIPFSPANGDAVLSAVRRFDPRVVGFSLIFQYSLDEFRKLIRHLRDNGVSAHFTAGGHFPSLRPRETFDLIPELDSIVRFEGEITLLKLLEELDHRDRWEKIAGLAFRRDTGIVVTEPRSLIADLDSLPQLVRDTPLEMVGGIKGAAMLGSRGCLFDCTFCSIRQFYGASRGLLRRARSPQAVVAEMSHLYHEREIRFFSFQDDDFASRSRAQKDWVTAFLKELRTRRLVGSIAWKVSCRVDDVESEMLGKMQDHGLFGVYLGVESGSDAGLRTLNKHVSSKQNLVAVDLLKRHNIALSIGFMLFDPYSTTDTIRENIRFLKTVGEDGYFPINFCKMLPYAGTPIEARLRNEGRLQGTATQPDYDYADGRLNWYEFLVQRLFQRRNFSTDGNVMLLQQADFDRRLATQFALAVPYQEYGTALTRIIQRSNICATETLELLLDDLLTYDVEHLLQDKDRLVMLFEQEWREEMRVEVDLQKLCLSSGVSCQANSRYLVDEQKI